MFKNSVSEIISVVHINNVSVKFHILIKSTNYQMHHKFGPIFQRECFFCAISHFEISSGGRPHTFGLLNGWQLWKFSLNIFSEFYTKFSSTQLFLLKISFFVKNFLGQGSHVKEQFTSI